MKISTDVATWYEDKDGFWVAFRTTNRPEAAQAALEVKEGYELEISPKRKKRSLDSNSYFWKLLGLLADKLNTTKNDLYLHYVKEVGTFRDFHLRPNEAPTFEVAWGKLGIGWPVERIDYTEGGDEVVIRAYYGSSTYDQRRMGRLIDMVVEDAKEQGIETMTPDELALMKERWKSEP